LVRVEITTGSRAPAAARSAVKGIAAARYARGARHADLLLPNAVAGKVASPARRVGQRLRDRVFVEGHGRLRARGDRDERVVRLLDAQRRSVLEQSQPRRFGGVALERAPGDPVPGLPPPRSDRRFGEYAQRVERVGQRAMALFSPQHRAGEALQSHVGRVGMRDREQVLGVEVAILLERRRHESRQEVALEAGVVGNHAATGEGVGDRGRQRFDRRGSRDVRSAESGQSLHGPGHGARGADEALERRQPLAPGIDQDDPDLEDLGARVVREAGRLQVDDRQRAGRRDEVRERAEIDPPVAGGAFGCRQRSVALRRRCRP
jgi:hypothetical protein